MALIKILPDQVTANWDVISFAIEKSLPPFVQITATRMSNILTALLTSNLECWISVDKEKTIEAVATTQMLEDFASGTKTILIYSTYGFNPISEVSWSEAFNTLCQYARNAGCQKISCYTTSEAIIHQANKFGGEIETFISFNL